MTYFTHPTNQLFLGDESNYQVTNRPIPPTDLLALTAWRVFFKLFS